MKNSSSIEYGNVVETKTTPDGVGAYTSTSSVARTSNSFSFTGGGPGDRKTAVPISFTKVTCTPGIGALIQNGVATYQKQVYDERLGWVWRTYQGSQSFSRVGILTPAGSIAPNSGLPSAIAGWGYPVDVTRLQDDALKDLIDRAMSGPNLAVDLLEGGQTVKMVRQVINLKRTVRDFFRELVIPRKLRGVSAGQRRLDYITGKWLEYSYGWKPLVNSIYDTYEQVHKTYTNQVVWYKGSAQDVFEDTYVEPGPYSGQGSLCMSPSIVSSTRAWRVKTSTRVLMKFGFRNADPGLSGYTSLNPLAIGYELMTLSFVVDWLYDIGGYLEALEKASILQKVSVGGFRTTTSMGIVSRTDSASQSYVGSVAPNTTGLTSGSYHEAGAGFVRKSKLRESMSTLPLPTMPHWQVNMGSRRYLSACALFHQLVARKLR